jgi:hypothetical protein
LQLPANRRMCDYRQPACEKCTSSKPLNLVIIQLEIEE